MYIIVFHLIPEYVLFSEFLVRTLPLQNDVGTDENSQPDDWESYWPRRSQDQRAERSSQAARSALLMNLVMVNRLQK